MSVSVLRKPLSFSPIYQAVCYPLHLDCWNLHFLANYQQITPSSAIAFPSTGKLSEGFRRKVCTVFTKNETLNQTPIIKINRF